MIENKDWWRGAVMYQIYPRSFMDANGDGIGDLPGIIDKLDYIASLGVEAVWISPFFQSPMKDYGYDISDYRSVDPLFGKNEDFDILIEKAHRLGLKIIIDMVLSHTSDKHPWFTESKSNRTNEKADWYVWADPKPDGSPPNNWQSCFGTSAWTFDTRRGQYYLHNFLKEQPDLNYHCEAVQEATLANCRFWLEKGVDGLRLDVINFLFCDKELRDNPPRLKSDGPTGVQVESVYPYIMQQHIHDKSQPENIEFLKRLHLLMTEFPGTMTLGEIGDDDPFRLAHKYTEDAYPLNTAYNTHMMSGNIGKKVTEDIIRSPIQEFQTLGDNSWPSWAFSNHDVVRTISRWGGEHAHNPKTVKMFLALLMSLRGTIFIYQGEELGLTEADIPFERLNDPWGMAMWPEWKGRDGCRTPIPWYHDRRHSGFSEYEGDTWLPIPDTHNQLAVNLQELNPQSPLHFTRKFIAWRKTQTPLILGNIHFIDTDHESVICFEREYQKSTIFCAFNMSEDDKTISLGTFKKLHLKGFDFVCGNFKE